MHIRKNIKVECRENDVSEFELDESSFLPPQDDRVYESLIYDIPNGDTFYEYAEYFWEEYGHEIYDEL